MKIISPRGNLASSASLSKLDYDQENVWYKSHHCESLISGLEPDASKIMFNSKYLDKSFMWWCHDKNTKEGYLYTILKFWHECLEQFNQ